MRWELGKGYITDARDCFYVFESDRKIVGKVWFDGEVKLKLDEKYAHIEKSFMKDLLGGKPMRCGGNAAIWKPDLKDPTMIPLIASALTEYTFARGRPLFTHPEKLAQIEKIPIPEKFR